MQKNILLDFILLQKYLPPMKKKVQQVTPGFVFLYIAVLLITPLFHLHVHDDHQNTDGETYHFHSLPLDTELPEHGESEEPVAEDLDLLQIMPRVNPIHSLALDTRFSPDVFFLCFKREAVSSQDYHKLTSPKKCLSNILSPQWDNFILYGAGISPPFA